MRARGITTGWSDGTFRPNAAVNRDAMAAFFYRFAGSPEQNTCLLYTSPSPRDPKTSRMPSSA